MNPQVNYDQRSAQVLGLPHLIAPLFHYLFYGVYVAKWIKEENYKVGKYYSVGYDKILKDFPNYLSNERTCRRYMEALEKQGFIVRSTERNRPLFRITAKGKGYKINNRREESRPIAVVPRPYSED